jgi:lactoylglutathione lyase
MFSSPARWKADMCVDKSQHPNNRVRLAHAAVWVPVLDTAAEFWREYFQASVGPPYASARRPGFTSRFVTLPGDSASIELMSAPWIEPEIAKDRVGWAHVAISVGSAATVDALAKKFDAAGLLMEQPRVTGDGFYEAVVCMPPGILIELTA